MLNSLFWSFMEQGGSRVAQLVVQLVLARLLAPDAFGLLAILLVFVNVADAVAQSGMGTALVQREGADGDDYSTALWLSLALALAMYAVVFLAAPTVEAFYEMDGLVAPLRAISLTFVLNSANSIQRSYLQKHMDFRGLCKANVLAIAGSGVIGIASALAGLGVWALVAQYVSQAALACVTLLWLSPWRPSLVFRARSARELYAYGWKICVTSILGTIYTSVSELILGRVCSSAELGLYSQGRKWPNAAIQLFSNALQNVFLPRFASLQSDVGALRTAMRRMLVDGSFLVVPLSCLTAVASEPIVDLLLGPSWAGCAPIFGLTCLGNVVLILQIVNLRAYMALGRSDLYLGLQAVKVLVGGAALAAAAVLTRDIAAVAAANLAVTLLNVVVVDLGPASRVHGYSRAEQLRDVAPIAAVSMCAAACSFPLLLLGAPAAVILLLQVCVFVAVFLLLSRLLGLEGASDVRRALESVLGVIVGRARGR